jgi:hypothetical protein
MKDDLYVVTLRVCDEASCLITLGIADEIEAKEWLEQLRLAICIAEGRTHITQAPFRVARREKSPEYLDAVYKELKVLLSRDLSTWRAVGLTEHSIIRMYSDPVVPTTLSCTLVLLNSPIELVARALVDVDSYTNWNTKLSAARRIHSLSSSTDIVQLSLKSWIGSWNCVMLRHYSVHKQNVRLVCASVPCTSVNSHFTVNMLAFDLKQTDTHTVLRCFSQLKSKRFQSQLHYALATGFSKLADCITLMPLDSLRPEVEITTEEKLRLARAADVSCNPVRPTQYRVKDLDTGEYYLSVPQDQPPVDLLQKLTAQQQPTFAEFKEKFPEIDNNTCYRFLKSRSFVIRKAVDILTEVLEWRSRVRPDLITAQEVVTERRRAFLLRIGVDRQERPILLLKARDYLPKEMRLEDVERYLLYTLESALSELPPHVDSYSMIIDVKDMAYRNFSLSQCKHILTLFQNYYPERLARAFVINTSWIVKIFWKSLKPFLHQDSIDKVSFLEAHELHILRDFVDLSQLPQEYGGSAVLSD